MALSASITPTMVSARLAEKPSPPGLWQQKKDSPFIRRWHEVFCQVMHDRRNVTDSSKHPLLRDIDPTNLKEFKDYLAMNSVMKRLIDLGPDMRSYWEHNTHLLNTNDSGYKWRFVLGVDEWYTEHEMDGLVRSNPPEDDWDAIKDVPLIKLNNAGGRLNKYDYSELLGGDNLISRIFSKALREFQSSSHATAGGSG